MLAPNTILQSRYRIISLINQGNMGAVYLAEDRRLGNEVALKETFSAGGDAELRDQFHREARLLSRLRHPALPRVIDHFIEGNGQFLVMDYITGKDLKESLDEQGGPFPVSKVLDWADQLLDVLTYLHAQNEPVIHRDIKPANIKLTPQEKVILLDFGLAKGASSSLLLSLPAATKAYAPIEQIIGLGTDGRSDLYALGVTLYHLLTNTLPPMALQRQGALANGLPDPLRLASEANSQVPVAVANALAQAMRLNGEQRYPHAKAMRESLQQARVSSVANNNDISTLIVSPPTLPADTFEFETVRDAAWGKATNRRKGQARYDIEDINGVALEMVEIPGGTFLRGSPETETDRLDRERPQHQVTVSPFYMGKYAVTQAQWRAVASLPQVKMDLNPAPSHFKGDSLPVEQVSWEDAMEFCERLSKATRKPYRLPTEAEWEYACRAGTTTPFAFGETIKSELVNYDGNHPYAYALKGKFRERTIPVGNLGVANGFGLYDMHGNVWEWCLDWYGENYYSQSPSADPRGPNIGSARVRRGGGWNNYAKYCRSASRGRDTPSYRYYHLGFRLVRALR
jgi:formylglycine-generating enzyme required for sulfatase activity